MHFISEQSPNNTVRAGPDSWTLAKYKYAIPKSCLTNILQPSAKAASNCFECLVEAGLASQVGVKSDCVR